MEPTLHLNEFFIEGGDQEQSHVLLHITEPSTEDEKKKGYFFAVCETSRADNKFILKLQGIIDEIENEYYDTPEGKSENILEPILEKANQQSVTLLNDDCDFHCVVGALRPPEIIFSFFNNPQVLLFYRKSDGAYHKMNLVDDNQEESSTDENHIFSQIIQGKIGQDDFLLLGTPHIGDYFSADRMQKILTTRTTGQSAKHLEKVLSELKNGQSFGGLIVHLEGDFKTLAAKTEAQKVIPHGKSVSDLYATVQNTADTLSPSVINSINSKIKNWQSNLSSPANTTIITRESGPSHKTAIESAHLKPHLSLGHSGQNGATKVMVHGLWEGLKTALNGLLWLVIFFFNIIKGILHGLINLFYIVTNLHNQRKPALDGARLMWRNFTQFFVQLSRLTKILTVLFILSALILAGGISYTKMQKNQKIADTLYQENLKTIASQIDAAEGALIYNDNAGALKELNKAREILKTLPCSSKEEKTTCVSVEGQISGILNKLRKVTVTKPVLIVDWSAQTGGLEHVLKIGNKILAFNSASSTIATYDFLTKESSTLNNNLPAGFNLGAVPKENDYAVLLYGQRDLYKFNPEDNTISKIDVEYPNSDAELKGLVVYNRRLYSLDTKNSEIYKHDSIKTGFALGKEWINDLSADLRNGIAFTVEGDVFVANNNGNINKFTKGLIQPFAIQDLEPALSTSKEIWSYNDLKYLYILDETGKRLIVLEKDGKVKTQIQANEFMRPTGMIIDEDNKIGYILDSNKLYQISLP